jgi:putative transposase
MNTERRAYKSDISDEQWQLIGPELERLTPPSHLGQPRKVDLREVYNTIQYQARTGCQWDMLPHDLLPKSTVYDYFKRWRDEGTLDRLNTHVVKLVRQADSTDRDEFASAGSIDSKTVPSTQACEGRGYDGGKKITGRKRNIVVDTLGLLMAVSVTLASVDDAMAARSVIPQIDRSAQPRLQTIWADNKYHNHSLNAHIESHPLVDWRIEVVRRPPGTKGFVLLPKRWVVERTFAWLDRYRRLSKDYEKREDSAEAWVKLVSINRMLRYLTPSPNQNPFNYPQKPASIICLQSKIV